MKLIKDLGMSYLTENSKRKSRFGIYECPNCNIYFRVDTSSVKSGKSTQCRQCGSTTHGKHKSRIYQCYHDMKNRCYNKKSEVYKYYGGRGIKVCKKWTNNFEAFEKWALKNNYTDDLTIDRKDNDGNYKPRNCRWTTRTIQSRNTRKLSVNNKSGYRGVSISKKGKKWIAQIKINNKTIRIGGFNKKKKAAKAYDNYIIKHNLEHTKNFNKQYDGTD